jgi:hypothetical protein
MRSARRATPTEPKYEFEKASSKAKCGESYFIDLFVQLLRMLRFGLYLFKTQMSQGRRTRNSVHFTDIKRRSQSAATRRKIRFETGNILKLTSTSKTKKRLSSIERETLHIRQKKANKNCKKPTSPTCCCCALLLAAFDWTHNAKQNTESTITSSTKNNQNDSARYWMRWQRRRRRRRGGIVAAVLRLLLARLQLAILWLLPTHDGVDRKIWILFDIRDVHRAARLRSSRTTTLYVKMIIIGDIKHIVVFARHTRLVDIPDVEAVVGVARNDVRAHRHERCRVLES